MPLAPKFSGTPYSAYPTAARTTEGVTGALQQALQLFLQLKQQGINNQLNQSKLGQEQQQIDISKGNLGVNQRNAQTNADAQQRLIEDSKGNDAQFVAQNYGNQPIDNTSSTMDLLRSQPQTSGLIRPIMDYPQPQIQDRLQSMPGGGIESLTGGVPRLQPGNVNDMGQQPSPLAPGNSQEPIDLQKLIGGQVPPARPVQSPAYYTPSMAPKPSGQSYLPQTEDSKLRASYYTTAAANQRNENTVNGAMARNTATNAAADNRNDASIKSRMAIAAVQNQAHLLGIESNNYAAATRIAEANALAAAQLDAKQYELYTKSPAFTQDLLKGLKDPNFIPQFPVPHLDMPRPPVVPNNPLGPTVTPSGLPPGVTVSPSVQVP